LDGESQHPDRALVEAALSGDRAARNALMHRVLPVVRGQARKSLQRMGRPFGDAQLDDFVQESLCRLLQRDVLRAWNPAFGVPLECFVRLVVRRSLRDQLGRRGPSAVEADWAEDFGEDNLSTATETRNELDLVLARLDLSGRDRELFERLMLEGHSTAEAAAALAMTTDAVKKWRSRFYARAREIRDRLRSLRSPSKRPA
jgi:RNA polymerase sigma factor (sigma-70 family)